MLQHADTHTERGCCQNASVLRCQEATSSAQQLGPLDSFFFVALDRSNANSHSRTLFCSISPTEETFKRSVHLADLTQASLRFSPHLSPQSWHGSWRSRSSTETSHHRSLTRAWRLGGFSQVFLTHPVPESHSAAGRLQPFVTLPVRAWLRLTGDGCVKQLSSPIQKRERRMREGV